MSARHPDDDLGVQVSMRLIALVSLIVPHASRGDWRREWEAEVWHRWDRLARWNHVDRRARLGLWRRCTGAIVDAVCVRSSSLVEVSFAEDVRHGVRALAETPGATLRSVLSLGLAFAAASAFVWAAPSYVRPTLPVSSPERLVTVRNTYTASERATLPVSAPEYEDVRRQSTVFEAVAAYDVANVSVRFGRDRRPARVARVSRSFFDVLDVRPVLGETRGVAATATPVVLAWEFWERETGGTADVVGAPIVVGSRVYTVAAVMPAGLAFPEHVDLWLLDEPIEASAARGGRDCRFLNVVGRLRKDVSGGAARQALAGSVHGVAASGSGDDAPRWGIEVVPVSSALTDRARTTLVAPLVSFALLLLLACTTVAARLVALDSLCRRMAQSGLLAAAGGALGLGAACLAMPVLGQPGPDLGAVSIAAAIVVLVSVAIALGAMVSHRRLALASGALAVALLVGAGVAGADAYRLATRDLGFEPDGVVSVQVAPERPLDDTLDGVRRLPGVEAVGAISVLPYGGGSADWSLVVDGWVPRRASEVPNHECRAVSPGYFGAMRIPVVEGRGFVESDDATGPDVAIVNEAFARRYWRGERAVGKRIRLAHRGGWRTIVGVVGDVRERSPDSGPTPELYLPFAQFEARSISVVARLAPGSTTTTDAVAASGVRVVSNVRRMEDLVDEWIAPRRRAAALVGLFAAIAVAIAAPAGMNRRVRWG